MAKKKELTASEMGRKGGKRRAKNLTTEQLSAIGKKGAAHRWNKRKGDKSDAR